MLALLGSSTGAADTRDRADVCDHGAVEAGSMDKAGGVPKTIEDLRVGERIVAPGEYDVTPENIRAFAEAYDPQPIHLDIGAARDGMFGGIVASGWHTLSATMRLMVDARPFGDTPLVGVQIDALHFLRPVRPGDQLSAEAEVLDLRVSSSRPDRGFARLRITTRDQDGSIVLTQDWTMLLPAARDPGTPPVS
jgi:acyl dehydratase